MVPKFTELSDKDPGLGPSSQEGSRCHFHILLWRHHSLNFGCVKQLIPLHLSPGVSSSKREDVEKQPWGHPTSFTLAPDACQVQRKESRVLPLHPSQSWLAGLPSDKSCARTPTGPECGFLHHCGLWCKSYTPGSFCILQTSNIPTALPGRIIHFSRSEQVCFERKNISMATDPSHAVEWFMQLS